MSKFLSAQQTAARMIAKAGSGVTLTREEVLAYDPVTQEQQVTTTTAVFQAVAFPPSAAAKHRVGSLEGRNALEVYFAQKDQTMRPQPGDTALIGGILYKVFWSQTYDPALDGAIMTIAYVER